MRIIFLICLCFLSYNISAQHLEKIKGRVVDEAGQPVAYATVGILNTWIGTATNEKGYFDLDISTVPDTASIQVSAISFKTFVQRIERISNRDSILIKLTPHYVVLKELEISSAGQDARHIVQKALLNWHKNYPQQKYELKGFYRELLRNDDTYVFLTEAAFTMQDRGYHKTNDKKFRIDALRKSDDMREMDSLDIYYDRFMSDNDLENLLSADFIDSQGHEWSIPFFPFFNEGFMADHSFFLDSISYFNDSQVYCISFYIDGKWAKYQRSRIEYNHLIINAKDYAIIEYGLKSKPKKVTYTKNEKKGNVSYLIDGEFFASKRVKFTKYEGHYYPFVISRYSALVGGDRQKSSRMAFEKLRATGASELDFDDVTYAGKKLNPDKNNYYRHQQLVVTSIKNSKDKFDRIKGADLMEKDVYVRDLNMPYVPKAWKGINGILLDKDLKAAKENLESFKPLEEQFVTNGMPHQ